MGKIIHNGVQITREITSLSSLVDSGSNANGNYIKFADGTMICTKTVSGDTTLSMWSSPIIFADINCGSFAQTFTDIKSVQITNNGSQIGAYSIRDYSTSSAGIARIIGISTASQSKGYNLNILAIGKWK